MIFGNKIEHGLRKAHKELTIGITEADEIRIAYNDFATDTKTIELSTDEAGLIMDWLKQSIDHVVHSRIKASVEKLHRVETPQIFKYKSDEEATENDNDD